MQKSSQFQRFGFIVLSAASLLFSNLPGMANAALNCSDEDREYAAFWNNYYDPEEAYKFGLVVKQLVADRNLTGFFDLVPGELRRGPRKRFVENRTFDEVFTEDWRNSVLASEVPCSPVGWRGFELANGLIWYRFDPSPPGTWNIVTTNGAVEEKYINAASDPVWRVEGRIVLPECFTKEWMSSDNYKAYARAYGMEYFGDFWKYPGKYFGREIDRIDPIDNPWKEDGEPIRMAVFLDECLPTNHAPSENLQRPVTVDANGVTSGICDKTGCDKNFYRLLASVSQADCQKMAPHLPGRCESAYLVETYRDYGGSLGPNFGFNFYGLFSLDDGRKAILPLVNFSKENDARNFLDKLRISH